MLHSRTHKPNKYIYARAKKLKKREKKTNIEIEKWIKEKWLEIAKSVHSASTHARTHTLTSKMKTKTTKTKIEVENDRQTAIYTVTIYRKSFRMQSTATSNANSNDNSNSQTLTHGCDEEARTYNEPATVLWQKENRLRLNFTVFANEKLFKHSLHQYVCTCESTSLSSLSSWLLCCMGFRIHILLDIEYYILAVLVHGISMCAISSSIRSCFRSLHAFTFSTDESKWMSESEHGYCVDKENHRQTYSLLYT